LASTKATDMQGLIDAIESKKIDAKISVLISNKKEAYAITRAKEHNIKSVIIESKGREREEFDREVASVLEENGVELILLIGYMRILSGFFVNKYKNKIMNIHPSLLPAFAGGMDKDVHLEILNSGVKVTGCTLHFVDESVDGGPIIMQKSVDISIDETVESLKEKVQKAEQEVIVKSVKLYSEGKIEVKDNKVKISK